jgi:uncharacterized protein (TIGR03790 family)
MMPFSFAFQNWGARPPANGRRQVAGPKRGQVRALQSLRRSLVVLVAFGLLGGPVANSFAGGDEVVVVYNSRMTDSKAVADYYARKRNVPKEQVLGFALPTTEEMTRAEFRTDFQRQLVRKLEDLKLWKPGAGEIPGTNGKSARLVRKIVASKVRYLVLCYGVPLRILRDNNLDEPIEDTLRPELRRNEAAVDSELACLPQTYSGYPLAGPLYNPLYTATNAMMLHPTNGLLLVARLDGPTPEIARRLVDKALQAETDGLWGRAYFDLRSITDPGYKAGDDWIRAASEVSRMVGLETTVDEGGNVFPAGFPLSQIAYYAGWYSENVAGAMTAPTPEFMPGAFAYHLHSFSAASVRNTNHNWVGPLLAKGVTATMGCVDEPYLTGTPDIGVFTARWMYFGLTFGEAAYAAQPVISWQTTVVGDPLYRPFGKNPIELHNDLAERKSPLIEWSTLRIVNLSRARGMSLAEVVLILEDTPTTKESAVLTEKLGDLYAAQGKPTSAIAAYERALKLKPSPEQHIRLRLTLGDKLVAARQETDAVKNYQRLLEETPGYPDAAGIQQRIAKLSSKTAK